MKLFWEFPWRCFQGRGGVPRHVRGGLGGQRPPSGFVNPPLIFLVALGNYLEAHKTVSGKVQNLFCYAFVPKRFIDSCTNESEMNF